MTSGQASRRCREEHYKREQKQTRTEEQESAVKWRCLTKAKCDAHSWGRARTGTRAREGGTREITIEIKRIRKEVMMDGEG